jgi:hypothetical protein
MTAYETVMYIRSANRAMIVRSWHIAAFAAEGVLSKHGLRPLSQILGRLETSIAETPKYNPETTTKFLKGFIAAHNARVQSGEA